MDIASTPWLNPIMRSGFLTLCGFVALQSAPLAQTSLPPIITDHPVGAVAYIGDPVTLSAKVEGDAPLSFQWHKNGLVIAGATNPAFTLSAATLADTAVYHMVATNPFGSAPTQPVAIYVTKRPQTITFEPTSSTAVAGSSMILNAKSSANLPVTLTLVSGAATLSGNILTGSGGNVMVRATQAGNETIAAADNVERTFSFVSGSLSPFITSPPVDQTVNAGTGVTLRGSAIGTPAPSYQWQKDGVTLSGATTPTLTLATTTLADAGRYTLTATNAAGTASASAVLTVRAAPVLTASPADRTIFAGENTSFTVAVTGFPTPTFQWRRNGTAIIGATNATLTLTGATAANAGRYDVVATNILGSTTSSAATLTVNTRDFSGDYFGRFTGATGDFALHVRPDGTAAFLANLPGLQTGLATLALRIDLAGNFSLNLATLASTGALSPFETPLATAAAPQTVTLRGAIDDVTGAITGTIAELGAAFEGTRAARTGRFAAQAGLYPAALIGSATARGYAIVAADGQAFVLTSSGSAPDAARGTLDNTGRLVVTSTAQTALDLTFSNGALKGTLRVGGATGTIAGAIEALIGSEHVANLSVRTVTSPGASTLITGFVVSGSSSKQVLIRAAGPALAAAPFNLANALPDPTLQLYRGNTPIAQNDDWGTPASNAAAISAATTRAGAFPFRTGSADAALLTTLTPGAYSVVIGGGSGTTLAEVYEVLDNTEAPGTRRLVNVSARGLVAPTAPFIAGFVITGTAPQRVLIRGIGPTLGAAPFNVAGTLPNPQLTLFRDSTVVKTNDDWFRDPDAALIRDAAARAGAFALGANSLDAALLLYLEPGAYTVQISGPANANAANATGLALVEIYEAAP